MHFSNEALFFVTAFVEIFFVLFAARQGIDWLLGTVVLNLLLVTIFGSQLIMIFGFTTNAGNVFYASVFLATHFLLEQYGKKTALRTISYGAGFIVFFTVMSQLTGQFSAIPVDSVHSLIASPISFSLRITFASILAYVFAQTANISFYEWIKLRTMGKHLWLRSIGANTASQLIDSMLFFSIAFFDLPGPLLLQTILVGWLVKTLVVSLGTPFLYWNTLERRKT